MYGQYIFSSLQPLAGVAKRMTTHLLNLWISFWGFLSRKHTKLSQMEIPNNQLNIRKYTVYMCFCIIYIIFVKLIIDRSVECRVCLYHTNKLRLTMRHFMEMNSKYLCATFICSYYNLHWRTRTFSIHMSHSRNAMSQDKHEKAFWKHCEVRGPSVRGHYLNNKDKSTDQAPVQHIQRTLLKGEHRVSHFRVLQNALREDSIPKVWKGWWRHHRGHNESSPNKRVGVTECVELSRCGKEVCH